MLTVELLNLIDTYNPDDVTGTDSRLKEVINNAEVFMADFTTFRRSGFTRGGVVFICFKNSLTFRIYG